MAALNDGGIHSTRSVWGTAEETWDLKTLENNSERMGL